MRDVPAGGVLRVIATDPGAVKDFEHFCKTTGHRLLAQREEAGKLIFEIERAG
jgi:tRNA 2-thiouridine synthesizing protein A